MTPLNFHHFDLLANIRDPRPWTPSPHRDNETDIIKDENHEIAPPDEKRKERAPRTLSNKALISRLKRRGLDNRIAEILADDIANELETSNPPVSTTRAAGILSPNHSKKKTSPEHRRTPQRCAFFAKKFWGSAPNPDPFCNAQCPGV